MNLILAFHFTLYSVMTYAELSFRHACAGPCHWLLWIILTSRHRSPGARVQLSDCTVHCTKTPEPPYTTGSLQSKDGFSDSKCWKKVATALGKALKSVVVGRSLSIHGLDSVDWCSQRIQEVHEIERRWPFINSSRWGFDDELPLSQYLRRKCITWLFDPPKLAEQQ